MPTSLAQPAIVSRSEFTAGQQEKSMIAVVMMRVLDMVSSLVVPDIYP